jgi:hypothetical protein
MNVRQTPCVALPVKLWQFLPELLSAVRQTLLDVRQNLLTHFKSL